jgi:predicted kinase
VSKSLTDICLLFFFVFKDRPHLAPGTRRAVVTECKKYGVLKVECVFFQFPFPVCKERLVKSGREDQIPTLQNQIKTLKKPKNNEGSISFILYVVVSYRF